MKKNTTKIAASKKYADYSKATQQFMGAVESHLVEKFQEIKPQWDGLLFMLATQFEVFQQCKARIKEDGMMVLSRFGTYEKHPLLKAQTDAQIQIVKLVAEFGLSPRAMQKLTTTTDNEDDFISALTN